MKGGDEAEDDPVMLDRLTATGREAAPVAQALDLVDDRRRRVAAEKEISVQRMGGGFFDGALRRDQSLGDHQPAENPLPADLRAAAPKQIVLDFLQIENVEKIGDRLGHANGSPSPQNEAPRRSAAAQGSTVERLFVRPSSPRAH